MDEAIKINRVTIKDFAIISEADVTPNSKLNMLVGKNASGKTSFIEAIAACLKGSSNPDIISHGADKTELMVDLGAWRAHRTITRKGQKLKVTNAEGDIKSHPQTFLDSLLGDFAFDPIAFVLLQGKERVKYLQDLFKTTVTADMLPFVDEETRGRVDYTQDGLTVLKGLENIYYAKRTEINKQSKNKEALYDAVRPKDYTPPQPDDPVGKDPETIRVSIRGAEKQLTEAEATTRLAEINKGHHERIAKKIDELEAVLKEINSEEIDLIPKYAQEIEEIKAQITELQERLSCAEKNHTGAILLMDTRNDTIKAIEEQKASYEVFPIPEIPDVEAIKNNIAILEIQVTDAKQEQEKREAYRKAQMILNEAEALKAESTGLSEIIDKLRDELPAEILKAADWPIPELRIDGDKIMIGEYSVDRMSTSEKIRTALRIVRQLNRDAKLKALFVDRFESFDDETAQEFADQIKDDGYQYFVTRVMFDKERPEGSLLVESGEVKA